MEIFVPALLLNLFLLPFYVTKFHRRFLVTWHLIPLLAGQWAFDVVFTIPPYFVNWAHFNFTENVLMASVAIGLVAVIAFFYSTLSTRDADVRSRQQHNFRIPRQQLLPLLFLRYFSIPTLVWSIPAFLTFGLGPLPGSPLFEGAVLLSGAVPFWVSLRYLQRLYRATYQGEYGELKLLRSDYAFLLIPLGVSIVSIILLSTVK